MAGASARSRAWAAVLALFCACLGAPHSLTARAPAVPAAGVLDKYCATCHNSRLKTAGLLLDTLDPARVGDHAEQWEKVVTKLRTGEMPPPGRPRPDAETYRAVASALEGALDAARAGVSTAGTRANRAYAVVEVGAVAPELVELAYDPQTAGGLLISLPRDKGMALEAEFARAGLFLARIGAVVDGSGVSLN